MEPPSRNDVAFTIHLVTTHDSPEFTYLNHALTHSTIIGLDAEWKPNRQPATFPTVSLLQLACRLEGNFYEEPAVFLIDLQAVQLGPVYELLSQVFVSPNVIKLGFRFKQDLVYLSHTFCDRGGACSPGFDRVEPFVDVTALYNFLQPKQLGRRQPKQSNSLAVICKEVLGITLSKELQCSDWSKRPLTDEQKIYAAADAHCLVKIFDVFHWKVVKEGNLFRNRHKTSDLDSGLKEIFEISDGYNTVTRARFCEAQSMIPTTLPESRDRTESTDVHSNASFESAKRLSDSLMWIAKKHEDKILLKDSDRMPKTSKKKAKMHPSEPEKKEKSQETVEDWQGPPPWDISSGGDGLPKFLCDVMVEGLAKHLRCVGVDAAVPRSKRPEPRELLDQAKKEGRVLLTRDAKLLRYGYLINNQIYRIKSLLKNEQLLEVIEAFQLTISEDQLMSRCTKCNGRFIQKPLTTEEAVEASKGFQVIPNCLFNKNLEFWQCMDCHQLYWEGTQYHNAVQKFIDVCKLNDQPCLGLEQK